LLINYICKLHKETGFLFDIVCNSNTRNFYRRYKFFKTIITVDDNSFLKNHNLLNRKYDQLLNLSYSRSYLSDLISSKVDAKNKITFKGDNANQHQDSLERNNNHYSEIINCSFPNLPEILKFFKFFKHLYPSFFKVPIFPKIDLCEEEVNWASLFFKNHHLNKNTTLCFYPGTGTSVRKYSNYRDLLRSIQERLGASIIILGTINDIKLANYCTDGLKNVINLCGKTSLSQCMALIKNSRCTLGGETGLSHIACSLSIFNTTVIGGGHIGRFMPYSDFSSLVLNPTSCYYCNWYCTQERVKCITDIDPELILRSLISSWNNFNLSKTSIYANYTCDAETIISKFFDYFDINFERFKSDSKIFVKLKELIQ